MSLLNIFRPKWQHSDPAVRLQAIQALGPENQEILASVARSDSSTEVRRAALRKLSLTDTLRACAEAETDAENRSIAQQRLQDEFVKVLKSHDGEPGADLQAMIPAMAASRHAEDLLRNSVSAAVRKSVAAACSKQGLLVQCAQKDLDEGVALQALARIDRDNLLEEVASRSRHTSVRQKATERLKAMQPAVDVAAETRLLEQRKREVLLNQAQRLAELKDCFKARSDFEALSAEAASLGLGDLQASFESLRDGVEQKCAAEQARIEAEQREAEAKLQREGELESLLSELESFLQQRLHGTPRIAQIAERWEALSGSAHALSRRFSMALDRLGRMAQSDNEIRLDDVQIAATREQVISRLKDLSQLDELDEGSEREIRNAVRTWETLPLVEGDDPQLQAYIHLRDQLGLRLRNQSESRQQAYESKLIELRAIIARVEAIDENQEFREIAKVLRQTYLDWKQTVGEDKYQFQEIWKEYRKASQRFQEMQQWESWHNEKDRESLIEEMQKLGEAEPGNELLAKVRQLQAQWKQVGHVAQPRLQELWDRFKEALDLVMDKCRPFLEEQNRERQTNLESKTAICEKAESLAADTSDNWKEKHKEMQAVQDAWKNAGPVPKEHNQPLWDRFRAACDTFYQQHKLFLRKEDEERQGNLEQKIALCEQAESLRESTDWNAATTRLKKLQDEWKSSGPVPKSQSESIWNRFRIACDAFFERKRGHFEQLDSAKTDNLRRKEALCERLEGMRLDPADPEIVAAVQTIETEWKSIGMVPKENVDALWDRFCSSTDQFLEKQAALQPELRAELDKRLESKLAMIDKVLECTDQAGSNQSADMVRAIQDEWKSLGRCGTREQELYRRFREVCDEFFTRRRDQLEIQEQARQNNLQKKLALCEQAEKLLQSEVSQQEAMNEVKHLRRLWKEIGAVPREHSDRIWKRFNTACDAVFQGGKTSPGGAPQQG